MPDPASYNVGRPLFGRTVSSLSNGVNHLAGFRGLRFISSQVMVAPSFFPVTVITNDTAQVGLMVSEPTMRWVVSPLAQFVWWGAWVASSGDRGTPPKLEVFLETVAGVLIDTVEWTIGNGRLPSNHYGFPNVVTPEERGASSGRDTLLHTGWKIGIGTPPRLLDVSAHQGLDVQIRVVAKDVRVYSHFALEAYESSI